MLAFPNFTENSACSEPNQSTMLELRKKPLPLSLGPDNSSNLEIPIELIDPR